MIKTNYPSPSTLIEDYSTKIMMFTKGLILSGLLPRSLIASRIEARSTTAGTPVKSYKQNPKEKLRQCLHQVVVISICTHHKHHL